MTASHSTAEKPLQMPPFPRPGKLMMRVLGFPLPEPPAVRWFAADRRAGLGVMAEFVVKHVFDEDLGDPWLGKARVDHDHWLRTGTVTGETD